MHRQRGWAEGGAENFRIHGSSRSSASYSEMTCRRYCFLEGGRGREARQGKGPLRSGAAAVTVAGAEVGALGAREYSRGFDGSA